MWVSIHTYTFSSVTVEAQRSDTTEKIKTPRAQLLFSNTILQLKQRGILGEMLILRPGKAKQKMCLEHVILQGIREMPKNNSR